jgi:hypothetical protein
MWKGVEGYSTLSFSYRDGGHRRIAPWRPGGPLLAGLTRPTPRPVRPARPASSRRPVRSVPPRCPGVALQVAATLDRGAVAALARREVLVHDAGDLRQRGVGGRGSGGDGG